jgi:peptidoglycan/xylan/chitin deacetylase (PgdA/CDA1 family)
LVAIAVVVSGAAGVVISRRWSAVPTWTVTVTVNGSPRPARVRAEHPSVRAFLTAASVAPRDGHLLSALSHTPIPDHDVPSRLRVDAAAATLDTPVLHNGASIELTDPADRVEGTTTQDGIAVPAPTPGPVERTLWAPGMPGTRREVRGAVSGEVVSSTVTQDPVPAAARTDNVVALTFDDGPWPDTPDFLAVLAAKAVPATFCMVGRQVLARPEITKQVAAAGMTLCNHSFDHNEHLSTADPTAMESDVQRGIDAQMTVLGTAPRLYRAPGGDLSPQIEDTVAGKGEQVLGWSVDPADYRDPAAQTIVDRVMAKVKPGAIILLHDGGGNRSQTLAALPLIIDRLRGAGYSFAIPAGLSVRPQ